MAVKKGKPTLIPMFRQRDIDNDLDEFVEEKRVNVLKVFQFSAEQFVNGCRNLRTYNDVTGNLRSSTGYVIAVDSTIKEKDVSGGDNPTPEGTRKAFSVGRRLAKGKGVVLVGVAGMEYGRSVEARGKDVITGPAKEAQETLTRLMDQL